MAALPKYAYKRITTGANVIKNTETTLAAVVVNKTLTGTLTLTDGAATVSAFAIGTLAGSILYGGAGGIQLQGLTATLSATDDVTIVYE